MLFTKLDAVTRHSVRAMESVFGDFDREAETLEEAIRSAIADVQTAGLSVARLEHVELTLGSKINDELAAATEF